MKTLLVLDDEPVILALLRRVLQPYRLIETTTAEQCLRAFRDHAQQVDLLISDVTLPESSGIQVALLLRSEKPELPVLLTSGYPLEAWDWRNCADMERLGSESVAILPKPFQAETLLYRVSKLLGTAPSEAVRTA